MKPGWRGLDGMKPGGTRRGRAIAAVAIGIAALTAGCGVQPTGVNIAKTEPFNAGTPSSSESVAPSQGSYKVSLFLYSRLNKGPGTMVDRWVGSEPTPADLPALLSEDSPLAQDDQYTSYVPAGITLKPTAQAHMYYLISPKPVDLRVLQQLYCTFDQYWLAHPDKNSSLRPSIRFLLPGGGDTSWQDCQDGIVNYAQTAAGPTPKASAPEAVKNSAGG